jgi:hypothetical protein
VTRLFIIHCGRLAAVCVPVDVSPIGLYNELDFCAAFAIAAVNVYTNYSLNLPSPMGSHFHEAK